LIGRRCQIFTFFFNWVVSSPSSTHTTHRHFSFLKNSRLKSYEKSNENIGIFFFCLGLDLKYIIRKKKIYIWCIPYNNLLDIFVKSTKKNCLEKDLKVDVQKFNLKCKIRTLDCPFRLANCFITPVNLWI
jgi:hypothetical protein